MHILSLSPAPKGKKKGGKRKEKKNRQKKKKKNIKEKKTRQKKRKKEKYQALETLFLGKIGDPWNSGSKKG